MHGDAGERSLHAPRKATGVDLVLERQRGRRMLRRMSARQFSFDMYGLSATIEHA